MGNVRSVVRAVELASGRTATVTRSAADVRGAEVLVVPGQGSFGVFARAVEGGLGDAIRAHVDAGRPYLGICLGMQVLFESSDEAPGARGLGVFRGHVRKLAPGLDPETAAPMALPHIGWNVVDFTPGSPLAPPAPPAPPGRPPSAHFYFAHTFAAAPDDASLVLGTTTYGADRFVSAVTKGRVLGVQFHPEKSQREGLALLRRFFSSVSSTGAA